MLSFGSDVSRTRSRIKQNRMLMAHKAIQWISHLVVRVSEDWIRFQVHPSGIDFHQVILFSVSFFQLCIIVDHLYIYRVSQEECARLREGVPYTKLYRYNPKHLSPKRNGYGDNGQRKVWSSCGSTHCTCRPTPALNVNSHDTLISWRLGSELHCIRKARCITQYS